jgi:hypothetical protein
MGALRKEQPGRSHGELMQELGQRWREGGDTKAAADTAAETENLCVNLAQALSIA